MSLFGFANINFNKLNSPTNGPLRALQGSSEFDLTTLRYPLDIGNYDKGHYVVFFIREQKKSAFARNDNIKDDAINVKQLAGTESFQFQDIPLPSNSGSNFGSGLLSKLNSGLGALNSATGNALSGVTGAIGSAAGGIVGGINSVFGQKSSPTISGGGSTLSTDIPTIKNKSFIRTTQLTKDAIALYMPDTMQFSYKQTYDQLYPGTELAGKLAAAGRTMIESQFKLAGNLYQEQMKEAVDKAGEIAKRAGLQQLSRAGGRLLGSPGTGEIGAYILSGVVSNPLLELLYKSPNLRTFQFEFMFYPRDEKEALEVQKILERFRFHQAPEFDGDLIGFLIPPSEFDIRFFYGGAQNPNIPPIGTCVLTDIDMNYAPNGWTAYEIPGESQPNLGRTGMPVAIHISLTFQETTYLTKSDFSREDRPSVSNNYNTNTPHL